MVLCALLLVACGDRPRTDVTTTKSTWHASPREERLHWSTQAGAVYPLPVTKAQGRKIPTIPTIPTTTYGSGACGGDLPTCAIMRCESGGNLHAHNPSGADGKWQFMAWDHYGGYPSASSAPEEVQDAKAREMWAGGRGWRNWVC